MSEQKVYETFEDYLRDICTNEEFALSLIEMETPEEVQAALLEKGIEADIETIKKMGSMVETMITKGDAELTLEEMDEVAGGLLITPALAAAAKVAVTVTAASAPVPPLLVAGMVASAVIGVAAIAVAIFRVRW